MRGFAGSLVLLIVVALLVGAGQRPASARADDFRIDTRIFVGDQREPHSENTTIFYHDQVFDFLTRPVEITIFDPRQGRFTRIDPERQARVELQTSEVSQFVDKLREQARLGDQPFLRFLAEPRFNEAWSPNGNILSLTSPFMSYRLDTVACRNDRVSRQYAEFSDGYARLNTLSNPASLPPFARQAVNAALARRGVLPAKVSLTIVAQSKPSRKEVRYQSVHDIHWRLADSDLDRVREATKLAGTLRQVELVKFNGPIEPAPRK